MYKYYAAKTPDMRYVTKLYRAFRKYGIDNFEISINRRM